MHAFWRCGFWVLIVCFAASGCHDPLLYVSGAYWNPDDDDSQEIARYGATPHQRIEAVRKLAEAASEDASKREPAVSELAQRIRTEADPLVRVEIITALGNAPTLSALNVLRAAIDDPDADVRVACCKAWGKIGARESRLNGRRNPTGASQQLAKVLASDTDLDVQIAAAHALGEFDDGGNIRALAIALEESSTDIAVQSNAMRSMEKVSGKNYGRDAEKWRQFAAGGNPAPVETPSVANRVFSWF